MCGGRGGGRKVGDGGVACAGAGAGVGRLGTAAWHVRGQAREGKDVGVGVRGSGRGRRG
jgi:hypothetical protein